MRIGAKGQLNELIAQDLQELHNQGVFPILQNKGEIKGKNFSSKFWELSLCTNAVLQFLLHKGWTLRSFIKPIVDPSKMIDQAWQLVYVLRAKETTRD